jgi:plasmid stability protein
VKNVTIALDEETHRKARIRAAELGTSLSALVKDYLNSLADSGAVSQGVREMPMPYKAAPADIAAPPMKGPDGQPYFVDGKWTFTKDGKPRKPGSMKGKLWVADDFDETPEWLIDAFYGIGSNEPWPDPE